MLETMVEVLAVIGGFCVVVCMIIVGKVIDVVLKDKTKQRNA